MTIAQFLTFMIAPAGGLVIAGIMLYVTRKDREREDRKARHTPRHSH
ncbi:hypothetical protein [Phyllobacterium salinisoli]|nr:hypothetical protein [Phyllobacterium salinisoli]